MNVPRSRSNGPENGRSFILLGGGGHAKVVAATLLAMRQSILGIADDDGVAPDGLTLLAAINNLEEKYSPAEMNLANAIGHIPTRTNFYEYFSALGYEFPSIVHPKSFVAEISTIGAGTQVMMGACIQTEAVVAENCIVNTGAIVEHDCKIGAHCHIAPGAVLCGTVELGKGVFIGAGAVVPPKTRIADGSFLKAGLVAKTRPETGDLVSRS